MLIDVFVITFKQYKEKLLICVFKTNEFKLLSSSLMLVQIFKPLLKTKKISLLLSSIKNYLISPIAAEGPLLNSLTLPVPS